MAEVTKLTTASLQSVINDHDTTHRVATGIKAGAAITAGDACYIASTGLAHPATGAAANAAAKVRGFAAMAAASGEAVTLLTDVEFDQYAAGMTPGANLYLSGTVAGMLADAASTGGTGVVGFAVTATRVRVFAGRY